MKAKSIMVILLIGLTFSLAYAQTTSHRGTFPRLLRGGDIVDVEGNALGSIRDGEVRDVTGKVIGLIASNGQVSYANGKGVIGVLSNDTLKTDTKVIAFVQDGAVFLNGSFAAFVDKGYMPQSHATIVYWFFSRKNANARIIDQTTYQ